MHAREQEEILDETDTSAEVTANLATKFMSKSKLPPPMRPRGEPLSPPPPLPSLSVNPDEHSEGSVASSSQ